MHPCSIRLPGRAFRRALDNLLVESLRDLLLKESIATGAAPEAELVGAALMFRRSMALMLSLGVLALVGAASGLIAGLVGLAGGIVIVPVLTWMYGPSVLHTAIAISWFCVLFNSVGAASKQLRNRTRDERRVLLQNARWYLIGTVLITPVVALVAAGERDLVSRHVVAVLQLCLAAVMFLPINQADSERRDTPVRDVAFGGVIGAVSTLIGVGGGTYTIAYFVYGTGTKFRDAIATANLTGLVIGILSVAGYFASLLLFAHQTNAASSPISNLGMAVLISAGMLAAPLGVRISTKLPVKRLRQILVVALMFSATRLLLS